MNALIPALIAVLLAEIGGPAARLAAQRPNLVAFVIALLVFASAGIGWSFAAIMKPEARLLMLGVLLLLAGLGQIRAGKPPRDSGFGRALALSRSSAAGIAFGFAAGLGEPLTPALGALAGFALAAGAVALGLAVPAVARRSAGGVLAATGAGAMLHALQLI